MGTDSKNALTAVILSALVLFGWQFYFAPKAPGEKTVPVTSVPSPQTEMKAAPTGPIEPPAGEAPILLKQGDFSIGLTTGLTFNAMSHKQTRFPFAETVESEKPLQIEIAPDGQNFRPLYFATVEQNDLRWIGEDAATGIRATLQFSGEAMGSLKITAPKPFKYRFTFATKSKKLENGQERKFSYYDDSLNHFSIGDDETEDTSVSWAGIDFNYHLFGVVFPKSQSLIARSTTDGQFQLAPGQAVTEMDVEIIYAKKEFNYLSSLGKNLKAAVDFGVWGFFAEIILRGLQFFYSLIPNYGIAIILLTFVVRLITFPLQYKSFVSMKKMQVVQPELMKLRDKFKDDPMRLQKESMELFKRSGANPLGGCLPLLLQLPVFFAFYKVLYSAVELVDAPFYFWIHDLSNKDPYYVLPVLVTGAMFLQQKLTPTTVTDPMQKKIFLFMPLIFGVIMKDLPSGLSLYIFVSTILGISQQLLVFRMINDKPVVV